MEGATSSEAGRAGQPSTGLLDPRIPSIISGKTGSWCDEDQLLGSRGRHIPDSVLSESVFFFFMKKNRGDLNIDDIDDRLGIIIGMELNHLKELFSQIKNGLILILSTSRDSTQQLRL